MKPNFLTEVLSNSHLLLARTIADFEKASGNSGVDTRLIADMRETAHSVMRAVNVDPADTTAEELYHALNSIIDSGKLALLANTQFVLLPFTEGPISFNILDVIENAHHQLPFGRRRVDHAQRQLRMEIIRRYAEHDRTSDELIHNLAAEVGLKREEDAHHHDVEYGPGAEEPTPRPRVLMIGDIFTDAFIKLNESSAKIIKEDDGKEWLALPFGQKPPYDSVDIVRSVGPSPNAAVSASRLGLDASLMAWVGSDDVGVEALQHLKNEKISVDSMVVEKDKLTSYWYVLRYGADRTMLVKSEKYRYEWQAPSIKPEWIYLSYIGADSWPLHESLISYLNENKDIKLAFQPGTFHFKWGIEKLKAVYERSHIVVMNREEAVDVTGRSYDDLQSLAEGLHELGPEIAVITDGPNGSYASYDGKMVTIPNYPDPADPLDRTGAGDAFASTIVSALALGEKMDDALTWAPINSMSVVQQLGAQAGLLSRDEIMRHLQNAPSDYLVTEV
ncbi:MAG: carbohydrate kinase family protein [Candidatus Saccharimonadales bacterium]